MDRKPPDRAPSDGPEYSIAESDNNYATDLQHVVAKVDLHVVGVMGLVVAIEFLDRVGLGFARISGIDEDLDLGREYRFSLIVLLGSVSSIFVQIPMMFISHRLRPQYAVGLSCIGWAAVMIGIGFSQSWIGLIPCRVLGGAFGGIAAQISVIVIQTWYTRYDTCRRFAWLSILTWLSKAVGGIAAFGIIKMAGIGSLAGWRWIYILGGILTFLAGLVSLGLLVGYCDDADWAPLCGDFLTPRERRILLNSLEQDRGDSEREDFLPQNVAKCALDCKFWLLGLIALGASSIITSLAVFSPMILHSDFGFDAAKAQGLYAPPYVFTAIVLWLVSQLSDRTKHRGIPLIACALLSVLGLVLIGFFSSLAARYTGFFFANAGLGSIGPLLTTFMANNVRRFHERSFGSAVIIGFGSIGSVIGASVFRSQDAPRYLPGLITSIALAAMVIVVTIILMLHFRSQNLQQQAGKVVLGGWAKFQYTY